MATAFMTCGSSNMRELWLNEDGDCSKNFTIKRIPTGFKYHMGVNFPGVDFLRTEPKKNKDGFVVGCFIVFIKSGFIKDRIR